jgi:hypothetical protein
VGLSKSSLLGGPSSPVTLNYVTRGQVFPIPGLEATERRLRFEYEKNDEKNVPTLMHRSRARKQGDQIGRNFRLVYFF